MLFVVTRFEVTGVHQKLNAPALKFNNAPLLLLSARSVHLSLPHCITTVPGYPNLSNGQRTSTTMASSSRTPSPTAQEPESTAGVYSLSDQTISQELDFVEEVRQCHITVTWGFSLALRSAMAIGVVSGLSDQSAHGPTRSMLHSRTQVANSQSSSSTERKQPPTLHASSHCELTENVVFLASSSLALIDGTK